MEVIIPTKADEIPLSKYVECFNIGNDESLDDTWKAKKIIKAITGAGYDALDRIPVRQLSELSAKIAAVLQQEQPFQQRFTWQGVEYGFIPNLQDLTTGEFVDIDSYSGDDFIENLHIVMAVLYRPIVEEYKELYKIEPYKGTDGEHFRELPISITTGALAFFFAFRSELVEQFPRLFNGVGEESPLARYGWFNVLHSLANGDILKIEEVEGEAISKVMFFLQYTKDKAEVKK